MKKILIPLQFIIVCIILIISSTTFYYLYNEKSASDWENENFIEEMYIQDNIAVSILCNNVSIKLDEFKSERTRFICHYSSQSCAACVNYAKQCIKDIFREQSSDIVYLVSDYALNEKFKDKNTINIGRKKLGVPLDDANLVYYFIIVDNRIEHVFIPDKNYPNYTESYLKQIKQRYFE